MVSRTFTRGLLSAVAQGQDYSTLEHVVDPIPKTDTFLKALLPDLTTKEELGAGQFVEPPWQTDVDAMLHDSGRQPGHHSRMRYTAVPQRHGFSSTMPTMPRSRWSTLSFSLNGNA